MSPVDTSRATAGIFNGENGGCDTDNSPDSLQRIGYFIWFCGAATALLPGFSYDEPNPGLTPRQKMIGAAVCFVIGLGLIIMGKRRDRNAIKNATLFDSLELEYQKSGQYDNAIVDCDRAIAVDPEDARAFLRRGFARLNCDQFDHAIADFDIAIRLNPGDADAFHCRGLAWHKKRLYDRAIADFDEAARLKPDDEAIFVDRGRAWRAKG